MREDDLATPVVEQFEAAHEHPAVSLEEPYDHYGNRGQVDAYVQVRDGPRVDYLLELKADAAVREATGANEILRQFRRMERYFYKDDEHGIRKRLGRDEPGVHLLLLFAPTVACVEHVGEHRSLYESVDPEARVSGVDASRKVAFLVGFDAAADGQLRFLSINGDASFDSEPFRAAMPDESRLAEALADADL
jgi:hypothetical protein